VRTVEIQRRAQRRAAPKDQARHLDDRPCLAAWRRSRVLLAARDARRILLALLAKVLAEAHRSQRVEAAVAIPRLHGEADLVQVVAVPRAVVRVVHGREERGAAVGEREGVLALGQRLPSSLHLDRPVVLERVYFFGPFLELAGAVGRLGEQQSEPEDLRRVRVRLARREP